MWKKLPKKWKWFALLAALGLFIELCCPGYDMTGLAFLGVAALIPAYHILGLIQIRHRTLGKGLSMIFTGLLILFFAAVSITGIIIVRSAQGTKNAESEYLVVLGAGVNGTVPSRSLRERLDAAHGYLTAHPDAIAIVSGGQGYGEDITEAQCMYDYLTAKGIAPHRVWMEPKATNTLENLKLSLDIVQEKTGVRPGRVAIVSSEYHLHRAGMFAGWLDLEAELVPAKTVVLPLRWNYYLREVFAVWYYSIFGG
ncbi:MAG: YdcF family protein [Oscillospiraceae bacterium]|nr:YdcF family protein [Oscillospiraceae bacterium]